jgi:hypothetical protein
MEARAAERELQGTPARLLATGNWYSQPAQQFPGSFRSKFLFDNSVLSIFSAQFTKPRNL